MPSPLSAPTARSRRWRSEIVAYGIAALLAAAVFLVTSLTSGSGETPPQADPTPAAEAAPEIQP